MPEQIVFPDTNTFLHYRALDQVDWLSILGADAAVIVIAPVVIRELNRTKDFPTSTKSRERARTSLRSLSTWSEQPSPIFIRPSVELKLLANEPLIDFRANNLSRDVSDDHLIASILEYKLLAADQICHLITADLGLKLKAKTRGFSVLQLSDELKLPDESLESEKRIKDLESQIRKLQNRIPLLKLLFEDGQSHVSFELKTPEELNPQSLTRSMNDIRSKYSKMERRPKNTTPDLGIAAFTAALATISPDIPMKEMDEYNQRLDNYFDEYEAYIPKLIDFNNLKLRTFELNVIIVNEGTCPAEDIEMLLHFPDGFSLFNKGELPDRPKPPGAPQRPVSGLELLKRNLYGLDSHMFLPRRARSRSATFSGENVAWEKRIDI
jgi:hypothetical protein